MHFLSSCLKTCFFPSGPFPTRPQGRAAGRGVGCGVRGLPSPLGRMHSKRVCARGLPCRAVLSARRSVSMGVPRRWAVGVRGMVTHTHDGEPVGVPHWVWQEQVAGGGSLPGSSRARWVFTEDGASVSERG